MCMHCAQGQADGCMCWMCASSSSLHGLYSVPFLSPSDALNMTEAASGCVACRRKMCLYVVSNLNRLIFVAFVAPTGPATALSNSTLLLRWYKGWVWQH